MSNDKDKIATAFGFLTGDEVDPKLLVNNFGRFTNGSVPIVTDGMGTAVVDTFALQTEIKDLRELLASYAGHPMMYRDDGELQDATVHPTIDFKRDSVAVIKAKLDERKRNELEALNVYLDSEDGVLSIKCKGCHQVRVPNDANCKNCESLAAIVQSLRSGDGSHVSPALGKPVSEA